MSLSNVIRKIKIKNFLFFFKFNIFIFLNWVFCHQTDLIIAPLIMCLVIIKWQSRCGSFCFFFQWKWNLFRRPDTRHTFASFFLNFSGRKKKKKYTYSRFSSSSESFPHMNDDRIAKKKKKKSPDFAYTHWNTQTHIARG